MPVAFVCDDHPDFRGGCTDDASAHMRDAHGRRAPLTLRTGPVRVTYTRQTIAQGNPERRTFACRVCGTRVTTTADVPRDAAYCKDHATT
jgi:hypothetical protein